MSKINYFFFLLFICQVAVSQAPDFTFNSENDLYCNPSRVSFTPVVSGSPVGYIWTFGNGQISNTRNPSITYNRAGTFTVKLVVIYNQTSSQVSKTITIHPAVTASIGLDRNYICTAGDINFTATASGVTPTFEWDFGDESAIESTKANNISHLYSTMGDYDVTLKATSNEGCSVTKTTSVKMSPPALSGTLSRDSGCIPASVTLATRSTIPSGSTITSYAWDVGDGSPVETNTSRSLTHTYTNTGSYRPQVTITTNEGCVATLNYKHLGFGIPPTNQVASAREYVICGSDSAVFFANATNANSYLWDFGDGNTQIVKGNTVKHKYRRLGVKTVTVTPSFNKCFGTPVTFDIEVVGVIASFGHKNTCQDFTTFDFTNRSQGNLSSILWDFGDGSPTQDSRDVVNTFPVSGAFLTRLIVEDTITGCKDTVSARIYTANANLSNEDTSICRNSNTSFRIENNNAGSTARYTWHVAGKVIGPVAGDKLTVKADILGSFKNYVIINRGTQYCNDTVRLIQPFIVRGPDLNFTAPDALCFGNPYQVLNSSKPARPQDSVLLWHWNFGLDEVNDSTYQPEPYDFARSGKFNVRLQATDIKGCTDSLIKPVTINGLPFVYVVPQLDTLCAGETATLVVFNNGTLDWKSTAAIPCATCDTLLVTPSVTSEYIATATTSFGCISADTALVKVYSPFTITSSSAESYICLNESTTISLEPPNKMVEWAPAEGISDPRAYEVVANPRQSTSYTVTMRDSVGCFSSIANINVTVKSLPQVEAGPDKVLPYNSSFSINPIYGNNVTSYNWTPSNTLSCATCPNPSGIVLNSEKYTIEVMSDSGCVSKDSINIIVECKSANLLIPNAFTPNNDNLNEIFYPIGRGIKTIRVFSVYDRYGKMVFQRKDFPPNDSNYGWDGKRNGMDQTTNVYVYYLEAECDQGEKLQKRGSVTLIR